MSKLNLNDDIVIARAIENLECAQIVEDIDNEE